MAQQFVRNPDVVLRDEDEDGGLLFNPDTNQILVLNPVAVSIWKSCEKEVSLNEIVTRATDEFTNVPEEAPEQVEKFLECMIAGGYITRTEE